MKENFIKIMMSNNVKNVLKIFVILLTGAFIFAAFFRPLEFEDNWWHLATGRWIVQNHAVPHDDVFSFTEKPAPWILTQWLGSTIYYLAYQAGGIIGLKIFRLFLFLAIILIFAFYVRKKIPFYYLIALIFFLVHGLLSSCLLRPLVFNLFFIQIFLIILIHYEKTRNAGKLLWLILLGALWSNLHFGSFIYGSILIGTFLFSSLVQYGNFLIEKRRILYSEHYAKPIKDLSLTLIFFWLSMVINPYGIDALLYPWKVFLLPDFIHFHQATAMVQEMMAPNVLSWPFWWAYALLALGFFSIITREKKDFTSILLMTVATFFLLFATRGNSFAVIIFVYVLALTTPSDRAISSKNRINQTFKFYKGFLFLLSLAIMLLASSEITTASFYREYMPNNPQKTIKFLKSHSIYGRAFCSDYIGSYLTWSLYPNVKPFIDGRQVNKHLFFEEFFPTVLDPENRWEKLDKTYDFHIVFLSFGGSAGFYTKLAQYLVKDPQWQIVLANSNDVLFVKKGSFQLPDEIEKYQNSLQNAILTNDQKNIFKQIADQKIPKGSRSFVEPSIYNDEIMEAVTLIDLGFYNAAIEKILMVQKRYGNTPFVIQTAKKFYEVLKKNVKGIFE